MEINDLTVPSSNVLLWQILNFIAIMVIFYMIWKLYKILTRNNKKNT
jgi:uncharacterized BrkB/YihY/UPF0761 family membrane protein